MTMHVWDAPGRVRSGYLAQLVLRAPGPWAVLNTWQEDAEDKVARDEDSEDAMTEANDEPVVEDASSSACGVTSEGRKTSEN